MGRAWVIQNEFKNDFCAGDLATGQGVGVGSMCMEYVRVKYYFREFAS